MVLFYSVLLTQNFIDDPLGDLTIHI